MKLTPKAAIVGIVVVGVAVLVGVMLASGGSTDGRTSSGSKITQTLGTATGNASIDLPIRLLEGGDAAHEADHIFEQLTGLTGVAAATLDAETLVLTVNYDSAAVDGAFIRQHMFLAGYTPLAEEDATPAVVSSDGTSQRIEIADDGAFEPAFVLAKAGVPLELVFAPGKDCRTSITVPDFEIEQDLTAGATVSLPAMDAGVYPIVCSGGAAEGAIIVE